MGNERKVLLRKTLGGILTRLEASSSALPEKPLT